MFNCTYCQKGFVRGDRLQMHKYACEKKSKKNNEVQKYHTVIQVGGGIIHTFNLESAFGDLSQT